jgi:predicted pyridoxine 5'-phosphate oxidase superfamily flavin-nucleotide-binding protein
MGDDRALIESAEFFFLATVDAQGQPQCSFKGGEPGFVRVVDDTTIAFPCYDGNGMFLSLGNIREARRVGLLFLNFERPTRLRLNGTAEVHEQDPLLALYHRGKSHRIPLFTSTVSRFSALTCHEPRIRFRLKPP